MDFQHTAADYFRYVQNEESKSEMDNLQNVLQIIGCLS